MNATNPMGCQFQQLRESFCYTHEDSLLEGNRSVNRYHWPSVNGSRPSLKRSRSFSNLVVDQKTSIDRVYREELHGKKLLLGMFEECVENDF